MKNTEKTKRPLRIYLSGAISSDENYYEKFQQVYKRIKDENPEVVVYNPAYISRYFHYTYWSWLDYIIFDIKLLARCDVIYFLEDYYKSHGARIEFEVAQKTRKLIMIENSNEPLDFTPENLNKWIIKNGGGGSNDENIS